MPDESARRQQPKRVIDHRHYVQLCAADRRRTECATTACALPSTCVSASTLLTAKSRSCQKLHPLVPCPNPNFRLRNASQLSERGMFCARWKCFHLAFWETRAVSGFGLIRPIKSRRGQPDRNSQSGFPCAFI